MNLTYNNLSNQKWSNAHVNRNHSLIWSSLGTVNVQTWTFQMSRTRTLTTQLSMTPLSQVPVKYKPHRRENTSGSVSPKSSRSSGSSSTKYVLRAHPSYAVCRRHPRSPRISSRRTSTSSTESAKSSLASMRSKAIYSMDSTWKSRGIPLSSNSKHSREHGSSTQKITME